MATTFLSGKNQEVGRKVSGFWTERIRKLDGKFQDFGRKKSGS